MRRFLRGLRALALPLVLTTAGCGRNPAASVYQKEITVFGYLWGGERLTAEHAVWIANTKPVTSEYRASEAALRNGDVTVTESGAGTVIRLRESPERPGYYFNDSLLVLPKASYRLAVRGSDGYAVSAVTTVPPALEVTTVLRDDTVNVVRPENLSREKPIFLGCEDPEQVVMVDLTCNETYRDAEYIKPFHENRKTPETQNEYDQGRNAEPRHIFAIARYRDFRSPEYAGQCVIFWYSSMLVFYGSYTLQVAAIDENLHRFLYTEHPELEGGIEGGIGVFGSMCGKRFRLEVVKGSIPL